MTVVAFDYNAWITRFPEFASVPADLAQLYFGEASILLDNTDCSPVQDPNIRAVLLNLLTAHIAKLNAPIDGQAGGANGGMVGRINSATEGSVSVGAEGSPIGTGDEMYYMQTQYGAMYWALTARYRTWRYYLGPQPFREGWPFGLNPWRTFT